MKSGPGLRDVLFLAYHFPPLGGAGVQRSSKFVRYLPEFEFRPVVVTGPDRGSASWPPQDRELTRDLRPDIPLYRVASPLDPRPGARLARLRSRLLISTTRFGRIWVEECVAMGLRAARETSPVLVFATMSPFESAQAAARLARELSIPWVADLRDPWALDEMFVYPTALHRWLAVRRMRRELGGASAIIMNTPEATRALCELLSNEAPLVATIPNGYDADDFRDPPPASTSRVFRIVHTGHLHAELGLRHRRTQWIRRLLGGERVAVEVLSRSHYYLLQALSRWREADPTITGRVLLVLAGDSSQLDRELVRRSGVADLVEMTGYLDHRASVALLWSADLLFLPMQGLPPGERARIVPGKTYEYLAAGRPILAAVPEGDARDLVVRSGIGDVCPPDDVARMVEILRRRYREAEEGIEPQPSSATLLHRFERRELTRELAAVFSKVLALAAPDQGRADQSA